MKKADAIAALAETADVLKSRWDARLMVLLADGKPRVRGALVEEIGTGKRADSASAATVDRAVKGLVHKGYVAAGTIPHTKVKTYVGTDKLRKLIAVLHGFHTAESGGDKR